MIDYSKSEERSLTWHLFEKEKPTEFCKCILIIREKHKQKYYFANWFPKGEIIINDLFVDVGDNSSEYAIIAKEDGFYYITEFCNPMPKKAIRIDKQVVAWAKLDEIDDVINCFYKGVSKA